MLVQNQEVNLAIVPPILWKGPDSDRARGEVTWFQEISKTSFCDLPAITFFAK